MRRVVSSWSVLLQLPKATDSIKYSTTEEKNGFLCYILNVKMHFENDFRTRLFVLSMLTVDATLSE